MFRFAGVSGPRMDGRLARRIPGSLLLLRHACLAFCMFSLTAAFFLWSRGIPNALMAVALCVAIAGWPLAAHGRNARKTVEASSQGSCPKLVRRVAGRTEHSGLDGNGVQLMPAEALIAVPLQKGLSDGGRRLRSPLRLAPASGERLTLGMA